MTLNLRRKMLDSIKDYQRLRDFSLAKATISFAYQDYLEKNQQFKFNIDSFFESMLLINLFPG